MEKNIIQEASKGLLDFHTHTNHSDGSDTPTELAKRAKDAGISSLALTDHNVISGLPEFKDACREQGIFYIPFGTEIYAALPQEVLTPADNEAPDLVILGKNARKGTLQEYHQVLTRDRKERWIPETLKGLESIGFTIPPFNLEEEVKDLGVPKILHDFIRHGENIDVLVKYIQNIVPETKREDIEKQPVKFINKNIYASGKPAYSPRIRGFNVKDAVQLAEAMNCSLFIAHPGGEYGFLSDAILNYYIKKGIKGIEVRSYFNTQEQNAKFDLLAREHNLIRSGGSDCHGDNSPSKIGAYDRPQNQLPKDILEELWFNLPQ